MTKENDLIMKRGPIPAFSIHYPLITMHFL